MANNFLNQLQMVVDTGKLQGVTNIKDLYEHFKDSGINYKDFKKQMHNYGIYGHLGKHDMARLSGMYYGSKKAGWEAKKPQDLARIEKGIFTPAFNLNTPNEISPLNIPVTEPVIQKTVVTSTPKKQNKSNKQQIAEVTKVVIPANSGDPNTYPIEEQIEELNQNLSYDPITGRVRPGGIIGIGSNEHNALRNSKIGSALKSVFDWAVRNQVTQGGNSAVQIGPTQTADQVRGGWNNFLGWLATRPGANPSFKNGGNLNKSQQGEKTSSQQDVVMEFVQNLAKTLQMDPNEIITISKQYPEILEKTVKTYQDNKEDIQKAAQTFTQELQTKIQAKRHGSKLNYVKSLKNQCADDEELYYYKKGGSVGCGCKKKEQGGELKEKKESVINKFKAIKKNQNGDKLKKLSDKALNDSISKYNKPYPKEYTSEDKIKQEEKLEKFEAEKERRKNIKKDCGGSKIKVAKCGAVSKFKKHKDGGSLNGIPFIRKGIK